MTTPIYAIGDVHGQLDMLKAAFSYIAEDGGPDAQVVLVGDYTDRGPDSRGVIEFLMQGLAAGRNWICLRGNHDRMFSRFVRHGDEHDDQIKSGLGWLNDRLGGATTLAAYGITGQMHLAVPRRGAPEELVHFDGPDGRRSTAQLQALAQSRVPPAHLDFLDSLPLYHETDDLIFVHAGLRPGIPLQNQTEDDLIWIRAPFLENDHDFGKLVVHGHTPVDVPGHFGNRVAIDTGAGYGHPLIPVVFEGRKVWALSGAGRVPL